MRCEQAMEWMSAKLDGELDPRQDAALSRHLQTCDACRQCWAAYQRIEQEVSSLQAEPPAVLYQDVMERVAQTPQIQPTKQKRFPWGIGTAVAAAAVLLLLLGTGSVELPRWSGGADGAARDVAGVETTELYDTAAGAAEAPAAEEAEPEEAAVTAAAPEMPMQPEEAVAEEAAADMPAAMPEETEEAAEAAQPQVVIPWTEASFSAAEEAGQSFNLEAYLAEQSRSVLAMRMSYQQAVELLAQWEQLDYLEIPAELALWQTIAEGVWQCPIAPALAEEIQSVFGGELYEGTSDGAILLLISQ